jgi:hypothetical protein
MAAESEHGKETIRLFNAPRLTPGLLSERPVYACVLSERHATTGAIGAHRPPVRTELKQTSH